MRWGSLLALAAVSLLATIGTTSAAFSSRATNDGSAFATGLFPPVLVLVPHATGAPVRGETLVSTTGTWTRADRYERQWLRCGATGTSCVAIAGATGASYTLTAADVGSTVAVRSTARNGVAGPTTDAASLTTTQAVVGVGPTLATPPAVTPPATGTTYSATTGTWNEGGISLLGLAGVFTNGTPTRQWLRCDRVGAACEAIPGATGATYVRTAADVGGRLRVRVVQPWSVLTVLGLVTLLSGQVAVTSEATPVVA